MKHEIGIAQPEHLVEDWPDKFQVFSWLEYIVTVPNPIFLITTLKENGKPNANLHSWGFPVGDCGHYSFLLTLLKNTHTFENIQRTGEFCVNYPSLQHSQACFETIRQNGPDNDEISESGFTIESARLVQAPRIGECFFNLECQLDWQHPLAAGSAWQTIVARVVHVAVDEAVMVPEPAERSRRMGLMYNLRSTVHALTGAYYGPNTLAVIDRVVKEW